MQTFTDNAGRIWTLTIHVTAVKRVRALVGVDLYGLVDDGMKPLAALVSDPVRLADVLYCLCKDEAGSRRITDEDFGRALAGDVIEQAATALVDEIIDFFPEARARASLRQVVTAGRAVQTRLLEHAQTVLATLDPAQIAANLLERPSPGGSSPSSGNSPAFSDSIPDR